MPIRACNAFGYPRDLRLHISPSDCIVKNQAGEYLKKQTPDGVTTATWDKEKQDWMPVGDK